MPLARSLMRNLRRAFCSICLIRSRLVPNTSAISSSVIALWADVALSFGLALSMLSKACGIYFLGIHSVLGSDGVTTTS